MATVSTECGGGYEFDPSTTALMVIDMQKDFLLSAELIGIVPRVRRILRAARRSGMMVVHTRYGYKRDLSNLPEAARRHSRRCGAEYGSQGPFGRILVEGEDGFMFVPELTPQKTELVLTKTSFGAFATTALEEHLRQRNVTHLILTGVTTNCCVESTLREAVDRGFFCLTIADAVAANDIRLHDNSLYAIQAESNIFGHVSTSSCLRACLRASLLPPHAHPHDDDVSSSSSSQLSSDDDDEDDGFSPVDFDFSGGAGIFSSSASSSCSSGMTVPQVTPSSSDDSDVAF